MRDEIAVPCNKSGVQFQQPVSHHIATHFGQAPCRDGVDRWLHKSASWRVRRCWRRELLAGPPAWIGKVVLRWRFVVEHNVRHPTVCPLRTEQRFELTYRTQRIDVHQPDGDEGAVPAPLVRVQPRRWFRPTAEVVLAQHAYRRRPQVTGHTTIVTPSEVRSQRTLSISGCRRSRWPGCTSKSARVTTLRS